MRVLTRDRFCGLIREYEGRMRRHSFRYPQVQKLADDRTRDRQVFGPRIVNS